MSIKVEKSRERGYSKFDWLESRFSYSFAGYINPERMGFGKLLVLNDDIIEGNSGFGMHPHNNMEIISIPIFGELTHKDTAGFEDKISGDMIQVMSAGTGIFHSEMNETNKKCNFLQIWIEPNKQNVKPNYESRKFNYHKNYLNQIINGPGIKINQDAKIFYSEFENHKQKYELRENYGLFIFLIEGSLKVNEIELNERDTCEIVNEKEIQIQSNKSKFIVIEIPL